MTVGGVGRADRVRGPDERRRARHDDRHAVEEHLEGVTAGVGVIHAAGDGHQVDDDLISDPDHGVATHVFVGDVVDRSVFQNLEGLPDAGDVRRVRVDEEIDVFGRARTAMRDPRQIRRSARIGRDGCSTSGRGGRDRRAAAHVRTGHHACHPRVSLLETAEPVHPARHQRTGPTHRRQRALQRGRVVPVGASVANRLDHQLMIAAGGLNASRLRPK
jgi:hypothetical protein